MPTQLTDVSSALAARRTERAQLLERALGLLRQDQKVSAAWLFGSMGKGTHDDLSDIDLRIIVADPYIAALRERRSEFAASVGKPLLLVEAPQNAPPGGAYLLAMYGGQAGPHYLDMSWQPQSTAQASGDNYVLFDRRAQGVSPPPLQEYKAFEPRPETAQTQAIFFWAMVPIAAKYIARRDGEKAQGMLTLLDFVLERLSAMLNLPPRQTNHLREHPNTLSDPAKQLFALRLLCTDMRKITAGKPEMQSAVSQEAIRQVYAALDLAQLMVENRR